MPLSYRMLQIGGQPAGLLGLEELFAALFEEGLTPNQEDAKDRLLRGVRQNNFVPKPASAAYADALAVEYQRYYQLRSAGKAAVGRSYGTWRGYPREQIPWFPTISPLLCNHCGDCLDLCARGVFERDEDGKVWVAEPFLCMVGCCFCKSVCDPKAILMPGQELLQNYPEKMR